MQGYFGVTVEEVLSINQQAADEVPVYRDAPALFQAHTGKLSDEFVKHGAFCQLESIGIIDERITFHHHHDSRGCHSRFI